MCVYKYISIHGVSGGIDEQSSNQVLAIFLSLALSLSRSRSFFLFYFNWRKILVEFLAEISVEDRGGVDQEVSARSVLVVDSLIMLCVW